MTTVVEFVGLPGTGKTTLSRGVAKKLTTRGVHVTEPTYELETRSTVRRVALKSRTAAVGFGRYPSAGLSASRAVFNTDQQSLTDYIRVLFNLLYITGTITKRRSAGGACLLDQGVYQGIWSAGFRSHHKWAKILDRFDNILQRLSPDLIVFLEVDEATIADRLRKRSDGDTRFEPGTETFDRGRAGYERLKAHVQTGRDGPRSIVLKNKTREALQQNTTLVADEIQRIDS
ncbi:uncharacterized protein Nmag_0133 [Natrialba magadii ATCC 43099]|uniref:Thymidylate kinase n=1 Tax=Natrialba magadii (strain ATCC 43099 / DSM 3394 / CCM 3739 / CIP 104546 / IAM 13178 / JCM 8861 / NBRC 102185 / NCIMB 2190 / MS3) TaxID=547559 RepID=D3SWD8_NATMM|nr:ATP-binding protein [Natrialba magadii]ADD03730.1 uncharacterized protein Nmag_0133 [Natrialba magadii ATCC 43099]ELY33785.1 hypothetical protein C500_01128 [Natrialba magadii ATCC 43099]